MKYTYLYIASKFLEQYCKLLTTEEEFIEGKMRALSKYKYVA